MNAELFSLRGKVVLITGASSGIGRALAKGLANSDARIVAVARRSERLADLVGEIQKMGGEAVAVSADITEVASVERAFDEAERAFGVADVIISNAGIGNPGAFLTVDAASRDAVFDTNIRGVWNTGQVGAQRLIAAGKPGAIINVASVLGLGVQPGLASYCVSKGAVIQLTRAMAIDLMRYNIRVNALAPGWFRTELNADFFDSEGGREYVARMPARRLGTLEELVGPVLLLASEGGSFMNGSVLVVDGALGAVVA